MFRLIAVQWEQERKRVKKWNKTRLSPGHSNRTGEIAQSIGWEKGLSATESETLNVQLLHKINNSDSNCQHFYWKIIIVLTPKNKCDAHLFRSILIGCIHTNCIYEFKWLFCVFSFLPFENMYTTQPNCISADVCLFRNWLPIMVFERYKQNGVEIVFCIWMGVSMSWCCCMPAIFNIIATR